jgi:hypothetical protein
MQHTVEWDRLGDYLFGRGGIIVLPYVPLGDTWSLSDDMMTHLFGLSHKGRHLQRTLRRHSFSEPESWRLFWQQPNNHLCVLFDEEGGPLLMAWYDIYWPDSILSHFLGFRSALGEKVRRAGRVMLSAWYDVLPWVQMVRGEIPTDNVLALRYVRELGFQTAGQLPGIGPDQVGLTLVYHRRLEHG